jgi:acyl carrier protein
VGTPVEELLAGIWSEVLKVEQVGVQDNFFELGGHSLLAMQVVSRIGNLLRLEVPLRSVLLYPVLREFASYIEELRSSGSTFSRIEAVPRTAVPQPSMNQDERLLMEWLNHLQGTKAPPFQHAMGVFFDDRPNLSALERALNEIIRRHEVFRCAFPDPAAMSTSQEAELIQKLSQPDLLQLGLFNLQLHPAAELSVSSRVVPVEEHESPKSKLLQVAAEETERSFVYQRPPLMRALLLEAGGVHLLVVILHHLVSDRWSVGVLQKELQVLYRYFAGHEESSALPELPVQYLDFAYWQRKRLSGKLLQQTLSYWQRHWQEFGAAQVQSCDLPFVHSAAQKPSFSSGRETLLLDHAFATSMRSFARKHNVTLYMLSLSAMYLLFHGYSRKSRVALWAYWANRSRPEFQSLIGWISTTHLLGVNISPQCPVSEFLAQVREIVLEASLYQEMPHASGIFIAERGLPRQLHLSDLYISFDFVGTSPAEQWDLGNGLIGRQAMLPSKEVGSSLEFVMTDTGRELSLDVRYAKDTFAAVNAHDILQNFKNVLERMLHDVRASLSFCSSIDALSAKSKAV